jgi:hypothetical protein
MPRLRIFPPIVTLYPLERQLFTAEAVPGPAMWTGVTDSGDIKSDYSLEVDPAGGQTSGFGAHWLFAGIGTVSLTIDDRCRPTSSGALHIQGRITDIAGFTYEYTLIIQATAIEVRDETSTLIFSESYSTLSGDIYRIELSGGFRFYRNGVLKHSRIGLPTVVLYPMLYRVSVIEPTAVAPTRIPQPLLIGDWRIGSVVEWVAPSHGATSYLGLAGSTEYHSGSTPGTYTLTARIEAAADADLVQQAAATIIIPPLYILGATEITLQPGQKARFRTNYPDDLIAWSVVSGGGSFTQGEFTAPSTPGSSVIRATADVNDQAGNLTVTVPAVITNPSNYIAAKPSEQIDFSSNIAASTIPELFSGGGIASGTGNVIVPLPPGVQENDVLWLISQTANQAVATPTDWAIVADSPQSSGSAGAAGAVRLSVFWRRWVPGMVPPTIVDPGDHVIAQIIATRGCAFSGNPWDVTAGNAVTTTTAVSIPGDTTTVINCLILGLIAHATDTALAQGAGYVNASLANLIERGDFSAIDGVGGGLAYVTGEKATAGAYSATTATLATSSAQGRISIAIKPGGLLWTASIGSIDAATGVWTAPSSPGQTAIIKATNGFFTATIEVPVLEVFPYEPSSPWQIDIRRTVLISTAEDRSRSSRIKDKDGLPFEAWEMVFKNADTVELAAVREFWKAHYPGKRLILEDGLRDLRLVGYMDSDIRVEVEGDCAINYSFRFIEG